MPLKRLQLKPGVNTEVTRYSAEGGWYSCDKIRFRQGYPEKIGGWTKTSSNTFDGVCRSIWSWSLLSGVKMRGVGTNAKFYLDVDGTYYDITPIRATQTLTNPFETTLGSAEVVVTDANGGFADGDYVTFSGSSAIGGLSLDGSYQISLNIDGTYNITAGSTATSSAAGGGTVTATYQISIGTSIDTTITGWGSGAWGTGAWGSGQSSEQGLRVWNQSNFGQNLIAGPSGGKLYLWNADTSYTTPMTLLSDEDGASDVPTIHNLLLISDISRFVFVFGTNNICGDDYDPMLIRWSDQEDATVWTPLATNQAGSLRLSRGSKIVAAIQSRQEILVWTDLALYSLQYYGAPEVWGAQIVGENISIESSRAVAYSGGVAYWMGNGKFYMYGGRTDTLRCDLRRHIFSDYNKNQQDQVFSGTNEAFNEIWWFYCSSGSTTIDSYIIYNYLEQIWYYGTLARTAWLDQAGNGYPIAATYNNKMVLHENGIDDNEGDSAVAITSYIQSSEFDIDDGQRFAFVRRVVPDITFNGSTAVSPTVDFTLYPLKGSGSGYNNPMSEGGISTDEIIRSSSSPVDVYTDQLYIRVRGRQMSLRLESDSLGVQWQWGIPRIDLRPDGRRG